MLNARADAGPGRFEDHKNDREQGKLKKQFRMWVGEIRWKGNRRCSLE